MDRAYTDAEIDAAIDAITEPERLREAQEIVARAAPSLQRVLASALAEGGWFDLAHDQAVSEAIGGEDRHERERAVRTLLAEETRLGMLVGVAVGYELARVLESIPPGPRSSNPPTPRPSNPPTPRPSPPGARSPGSDDTTKLED